MHVQVKSSNGITLVPMDTRLLASRKVFIRGEINQDAACAFMEQIMYLNEESATQPIQVFINSPGGEINAGMMMYDVIQGSKAPIRMYCAGQAYSMAAVLFASGKERYMLPNSELMLHEPLLGNRIGGSASSIRSVSESLMEAKAKINRLLAKHTGKSEKAMEKLTCYDHYFTPEESVAEGLCDKIVGFDVMIGG